MEYHYYNQISHCMVNLTIGIFGIPVKWDTNHFVWPRRCLFNYNNMLIP